MNKYKFLVATDMDYTLLMPGKPVSEANRLAVSSVYKAGGAVTLATGRTFYLTGSYARDLNITIPIITSNGAAISDPVTFRDIESVNIPSSILDLLIPMFINEHVNATGYSSEGLYFFPYSSRRKFIDDYNSQVPDDIKCVVLDHFNVSFNKFLLIDPPESIVSAIRSFPELQIVRSAKSFYDVMMKGTSKGQALKTIASSLGIPSDMTFAIGDSENDIPLLMATAHPVAMANSDPEVLQIAEHVTSDCESDGFALAVRDFILPLALN